MTVDAIDQSGMLGEGMLVIFFQFDSDEAHLGLIGSLDDHIVDWSGRDDDLRHGINPRGLGEFFDRFNGLLATTFVVDDAHDPDPVIAPAR